MSPAKIRKVVTCVFVALNIGRVSIQLNDLADQFVIAHFDKLVHFGSCHPLGHDHYDKRGSYGGRTP